MHELIDRVGLEHLLFFLNPEAENRSEEVSEPDRIVRAEYNHANLRRHLRQVSERLLNQRLHVALGSLDLFFVLYFQIGKNLHAGAQKRLLLYPLQYADSLSSLD